jgi:uncharacterized protein YbjQ (UPF0145 family)
MADLIGLIVNIAIFGGLILLGLFAGGRAERKHLRNLEERETALGGMLVTDLKSYPGGAEATPTPEMFVGEVSIACDYLKAMLASLRNLIGGEVRSFESLQLRARREATLRVMEQAQAKGFNSLANLRLETADIAGNITTNRKQRMVVVSVIASATGYARPS